jgi:fructoselysine-6-P-deglycase FrlB-like protein
MSDRGMYTREEIFSQPESWKTSLEMIARQSSDMEAFFRQGKFDQLLFVGCGSPYYAAQAIAPLAGRLTGRPARALPGSEVFHYPELSFVPGQRMLMVALSRSGETTELLRACEAFNAKQAGEIVTISCYPDRPLTKQGTINLLLTNAQETSLAQTRALSSLYLSSLALTCLWSNRRDLCKNTGSLRLPAGSLRGTSRAIGRRCTLLAFLFSRFRAALWIGKRTQPEDERDLPLALRAVPCFGIPPRTEGHG